jgi:hypothetical protein
LSCTTEYLSMSELDFVLALHTRHRNLTACCGPLLCVQISPWRAHGLEQIFDSDTASELLWSGHHSAEECLGVVGPQRDRQYVSVAGHKVDVASTISYGERMFLLSSGGTR